MIRTVIYDGRDNEPGLPGLPDVAEVLEEYLGEAIIGIINRLDSRKPKEHDPLQPRHHWISVERVKPSAFWCDLYILVELPARPLDFVGRYGRFKKFREAINEAIQAAYADHPSMPLPSLELDIDDRHSSGLRLSRDQKVVGEW